MRVTAEIHRNKRLISIIENTLERASRSLFKGIVNSFFGSLFAHSCYEIDDRDGYSRHPQGHTIEAPFQFRNNQCQSAGSSRGSGNNVSASRTSATQVFVNLIQNTLVIGIGMYGIHQTLFNTKGIVDDLGGRSETIGGAGSIGNDVVPGRVVHIFIDS